MHCGQQACWNLCTRPANRLLSGGKQARMNLAHDALMAMYLLPALLSDRILQGTMLRCVALDGTVLFLWASGIVLV